MVRGGENIPLGLVYIRLRSSFSHIISSSSSMFHPWLSQCLRRRAKGEEGEAQTFSEDMGTELGIL